MRDPSGFGAVRALVGQHAARLLVFRGVLPEIVLVVRGVVLVRIAAVAVVFVALAVLRVCAVIVGNLCLQRQLGRAVVILYEMAL